MVWSVSGLAIGAAASVVAGVVAYRRAKNLREQAKDQKKPVQPAASLRLRGAGGEEEKSFSDKMDEAGRPSLKSILLYFLPLTPMNPSPPMWLLSGLLPAALSYYFYFSAGIKPAAWLGYALLGAAAGDPALDARPAWLKAFDVGERFVLLIIHLAIAMFHVSIGDNMKTEGGAAAAAEARALAFTDAPKGSAVMDQFQWPPGPSIQKPALYMRFHSLLDVAPLVLMAIGKPDAAFMAMLVEKAGGFIDHLYMYGGTFIQRAKTLYPIMFALCLRLTALLFFRAAPSPYLGISSVGLDAAAHVAGGILVGFVARPIGWAVCGCAPASRGRPGRKQTPYKKA